MATTNICDIIVRDFLPIFSLLSFRKSRVLWNSWNCYRYPSYIQVFSEVLNNSLSISTTGTWKMDFLLKKQESVHRHFSPPLVYFKILISVLCLLFCLLKLRRKKTSVPSLKNHCLEISSIKYLLNLVNWNE